MESMIITRSGKVMLATPNNFDEIVESLDEEYFTLDSKSAVELINNISEVKIPDDSEIGLIANRFNIQEERIQLMENIAEEFGLSNPYNMFLKKRDRKYVIPRQLYQTILAIKSSMTLSSIAKLTGFDHATIIHSRKTILTYLEYNNEVRPKILRIFNLYGISYEAERKKYSQNYRSETTC